MTSLLSTSGVEPPEQAVLRYGQGAGGMLVAIAIASVPAGLVMSRSSAVTVLFLAALAAGTGALCLSIRWSELSLGAIAIAPALASAQAGLWAWLVDPVFGVYALFVAALVGYGFADRRLVAAHVVFAVVAILAPAALEPAAAEGIFAAGALFGALAPIVAAFGSHVRRELDARARAYRRFGGEALELAVRIRTAEIDPGQAPAGAAERRAAGFVPVPSPRARLPRWRGSALAGAALAAFALPLVAIASIGGDSPPVLPMEAEQSSGNELAAATGLPGKDKPAGDAKPEGDDAARIGERETRFAKARAYASGRQGGGATNAVDASGPGGDSTIPQAPAVAAAPALSASPDEGGSGAPRNGDNPTPTRGSAEPQAGVADGLITPVDEIRDALRELTGELEVLDPR